MHAKEISPLGPTASWSSLTTATTRIWAARSEYRLRKEGLDFRMAYKKVMLVNNHKPTFTLSFLI